MPLIGYELLVSDVVSPEVMGKESEETNDKNRDPNTSAAILFQQQLIREYGQTGNSLNREQRDN